MSRAPRLAPAEVPAETSALAEIGAAVRAVREARGLSEMAFARAVGLPVRALRALEAGEALDLAARIGPPPLSERVRRAIVQYVGADWLLKRPTLNATEAQLLGQILAAELRHGRRHHARGKLQTDPWQGTARDQLEALRDKLRQMAPPPKKAGPR